VVLAILCLDLRSMKFDELICSFLWVQLLLFSPLVSSFARTLAFFSVRQVNRLSGLFACVCLLSGRWGHSLGLLAKYYAGNADPRHMPAVTVYALAANLLLNSLNLFWAYKVLKYV